MIIGQYPFLDLLVPLSGKGFMDSLVHLPLIKGFLRFVSFFYILNVRTIWSMFAGCNYFVLIFSEERIRSCSCWSFQERKG